MPQKYYNVKEAAKLLGVADDEIKAMLDRRELHGYRDGSDWKFKSEDIERIAAERAEGSTDDDGSDDVLLSELELGHSDPGLSGTVIGNDKKKSAAESDLRMTGSEIGIAESGIELGAERKPGPGRKDDVGAKVSQFEELDLTLDQDLSLEDSGVDVGPQHKGAVGDSAVDLSGKKLEDDDLVLGGSGAGSDITIGGDSGISLVDPADSGLSLESPLNLGGGNEESLELGEDDLLAFSTDASSASGLKSEDDFQLTPMDDGGDGDDSESGSQVIALDTESEGDEAATMIAGGSPMATMLDDDLGDGGMGMAGAGALGGVALAGPGDMGDGFMQSAMALPEAPYSIWNILALVFVSLLLIVLGMMMYDLLRNMWGWEAPHPINSWLMDSILGLFEK